MEGGVEGPAGEKAGVVAEEVGLLSSVTSPVNAPAQRSVVIVFKTYHNPHTRALHHAPNAQHTRRNLPARNPSLHASTYDDDKRDERAQLDDDGEGDEEADGAP